MGLCGNFNFDRTDEFYTPSNIIESSASTFVNVFADSSCDPTTDYINVCEQQTNLVSINLLVYPYCYDSYLSISQSRILFKQLIPKSKFSGFRHFTLIYQ